MMNGITKKQCGISEEELAQILENEFTDVVEEREYCPSFLDEPFEIVSKEIHGVEEEIEDNVLPFYPVTVSPFTEGFTVEEAA